MKQQSSTILYLFIALIILSGVSLVIFKDNVADSLLNYDVVPAATNRAGGELKLDILRDSRIKELKNYVSVFSYEDLEKSQETILSNFNTGDDIVISNPDNEEAASSTKPQSITRVRVGNSNPFLIKKAVK